MGIAAPVRTEAEKGHHLVNNAKRHFLEVVLPNILDFVFPLASGFDLTLLS